MRVVGALWLVYKTAMQGELIILGLVKVAFGFLLGVGGIFLAWRILGRVLRKKGEQVPGPEHNVASGVLMASGIVALGILAEHSVHASFLAFDFTRQGGDLSADALGQMGLYVLAHVGLALAIGSIVLGAGAWVFNHLTRTVDELEEVREGNLGAAVVLGAILVVLAFMTAPGLETMLSGILPFPELPRGAVFHPR